MPVVTVKPPKVKLVASATKASVGDKVRLRWHSKRADVVMASGDWAGAQKTKGSVTVRIAERGKHVFKLTVKNAAGAKTATVKVLAARKAKTLELVVTEELTMVGSDVDLTADGLAKGEEYTVRLDGKSIMTGKANKKGDVARTFELAKTTAEGALALTITGSNPSRVGTAVLNVIKRRRRFDGRGGPGQGARRRPSRSRSPSPAWLADEALTVMYARREADARRRPTQTGEFTYTFNVGKKSGEQHRQGHRRHSATIWSRRPSRSWLRTGPGTRPVAGCCVSSDSEATALPDGVSRGPSTRPVGVQGRALAAYGPRPPGARSPDVVSRTTVTADQTGR